MPDLEIENSYQGVVCGIDEAGRGPWCGSVVAAAVVLGEGFPTSLNDSKKLSEKKREQIFDEVLRTCKVGIGEASVEEIDFLNIGKATKLAMRRAYENLAKICRIDAALVDGNQLPDLPCKMQFVIKGDAKSYSIAAASIVAKVTRDRQIHELAKQFPEYGWESNKGYGTAEHSQAIEKYGITAHHRKSYAPIKKYLVG